jgi:hypothetical protein
MLGSLTRLSWRLDFLVLSNHFPAAASHPIPVRQITSIEGVKFSRLIKAMAIIGASSAANEEFSCAGEDYEFV